MSFTVLMILLSVHAGAGRGDVVCSTFSIAAVDTLTGECGVAVASKVLAVGYIVPWARAGAGAVATQALANISLGPDGLELLEGGLSAADALEILLSSDEGFQERQLGVVDPDGGSATFTGTGTLHWAGGVAGPGYAIQGNILAGPEVIAAMEDAFLSSGGPLARRMVVALAAGDSAGGDSRGRQSAAILVCRPGGGYQGMGDVFVDIRVDDHEAPVSELARIYDLWEAVFMYPVYLDSGDGAGAGYAMDIMERILASGERDPQMLNNFAWALAERGLQPGRAVELAFEAHSLAPEDMNIVDTLAEALYAAGRYAEAVTWEQEALGREPGNEWFREQLVKFRAALDSLERAEIPPE